MAQHYLGKLETVMVMANYVESYRFNPTFLERNNIYTSISNLILIEGDDLRAETDFETDSSESRLQGSQCIFFI